MREVLYGAADLLRDLLRKRALDRELLGQLPEHRDHLYRILYILYRTVCPGRQLLPHALLPKLVTEPWVTDRLYSRNLRCQSLRCVL